MRPFSRFPWAAFALAGGLGAFGLLAVLEGVLDLGLVPAVLAEEAAKPLLLALGLLLAPTREGGPGPRGFRLLPGLAAIAVFAAAESLAYVLAFPTVDVVLRLAWSGPAHLVAGLAWALALDAAARGRGRQPFPALAFALLAPTWHLGLNLLASLLPGGGLGRGEAWAPLAAGAANLAILAVLAKYFAQRAIVGGFLYGDQ